VGKSSLLNTLANRRRLAHVSNTPGRTQLINLYSVNGTFCFVDLPGYGFARAPKAVRGQWDRMISGYLRRNPALRGVFALFDVRRDSLTEEDSALLDWMTHYAIPFAAVLTKADKLTRSEQARAVGLWKKLLAVYAPIGIFPFSATTRQGRPEILDALDGLVASPPRDAWE
jgi:GTP-binding protein